MAQNQSLLMHDRRCYLLLTYKMSPHTPLFQGARNVYMPHATITVAENVGIF